MCNEIQVNTKYWENQRNFNMNRYQTSDIGIVEFQIMRQGLFTPSFSSRWMENFILVFPVPS